MEVVPTVVKRVRIASGPINFEEELEHASVLLEEVQDEAVAVAEWARWWMLVSETWMAGCGI